MVPEAYAVSIYLLIGAALSFLANLCYHLCTSYGLANGHRSIGERSQPVQLIRENIRLSIASNHLILPPSVVRPEQYQPTSIVESVSTSTQSTQTAIQAAHSVSQTLETKSLKPRKESTFVLKPKPVKRTESAHMQAISLTRANFKAINYKAESNF
jgi:hypothetical protein